MSLQAANGSVSNPSITFASDTNTGFYASGSDDNTIKVTVGGVNNLDINENFTTLKTGDLVVNGGSIRVSRPFLSSPQVEILGASNAASRRLIIGLADYSNYWNIGQVGGEVGLTISGYGTAENEPITLSCGTGNINMYSNVVLSKKLYTTQTTSPSVYSTSGDISSASVGSGSTDTAGFISFVTSSGSSTGSVTVNFNSGYSSTPCVMLIPSDGSVSWALPASSLIPLRVSSVSGSGFSFELTTPVNTGTFVVNYYVVGIL